MAAGGQFTLVNDDMDEPDEVRTDLSVLVTPSCSASQVGARQPPQSPLHDVAMPPTADAALVVAVLPAPIAMFYCATACCWCLLKVALPEHGNVASAHAAFLKMQLSASGDQSVPQDVTTLVVNGLRMVLMACAMHAQLLNPSVENMDAIRHLQATGTVPTQPGPALPATHVAGSVPGGTQPEDGEAAASSQGSSRRKKGRKWWEDEETADWRLEPWVYDAEDRVRSIRVKLDGKQGWGELSAAGTQRLLAWYDKGKLMDVIKGVVANDTNGHAYDYRVEGGKFLTQDNPNFPQSPPRECQILYVGTNVEEESPSW